MSPVPLQPRHGPYQPNEAGDGGVPTVGEDVPITVVFLLFYLGAGVGHMAILQVNKRRNHRFILSGLMFGFCMARIVTMIMRIVWATHQHNLRVAIAAGIFVNAGVIILYIVDVIFAQRIIRAAHPNFGWHKSFMVIFTVIFGLIIPMLGMVITAVVQSFYTLSEHIHRIDRDLQMTGISYMVFFASLPIPLIVISLLVPKSERLDKFGSGSWRTKPAIVLTGTIILLTGAVYRASTVYKNPRPLDDPAWYHSKAAFYCFNFVPEVIVIYFYLLTRVDLRFHVPNKCKGYGDYRKGQSDPEKIEHTDAGTSQADDTSRIIDRRHSLTPVPESDDMQQPKQADISADTSRRVTPVPEWPAGTSHSVTPVPEWPSDDVQQPKSADMSPETSRRVTPLPDWPADTSHSVTPVPEWPSDDVRHSKPADKEDVE